MTSVSNGEIRAAIAYSNSGGSITQVIVRWRSFTLGTYSGGIQPVTINSELNVNPQGASDGGAESRNRSVNIWLNGTQVATNADAFGSNIYNCIGRLTTIRVVLSAEGRSNVASGPDKTGFALSFFDYTINLTDINPSSDFIFINPSGGKFVHLPPVSSNPGKLYYFKLKSAIPGNFIGNNVGGNGEQYQGQSIWINTYNGDSEIMDVTSRAIYINQNYACLTLFSNGTNWYIANYYPSTNQPSLSTSTTNVTNPSKIANAVSNCINIFNSTGSPRNTGDNLVYLPNASTPSMCIVAYVGDTGGGGRQNGNALLFSHANNIDENTGYNSSNFPYISTDASNDKSCGCVFISNGTYWYIVGRFYGEQWSWNNAPSTDGGFWNTLTPATNTINIIPINTFKFYILPLTVISNPGYFIIYKLTGEQNSSVIFYTHEDETSVNNVINNNTTKLYYAQSKKNSCIWFIGVNDGTRMKYYPIIGYTPH